MNNKPTLTVNTYISENVSTVSFELYGETLSDEIISTIDCPEIVWEIEKLRQSEEKPYSKDYMVDISCSNINKAKIFHEKVSEYWDYCKIIDSETDKYHKKWAVIFSRSVVIYPLSEITVKDTDISIVSHCTGEKVNRKFIDTVIRPRIYKEIAIKKQYQKNQNLEYIADIFLDDYSNDTVPSRAMVNKVYQSKNEGWTDSTAFTIEKAIENYDILIYIHERPKKRS